MSSLHNSLIVLLIELIIEWLISTNLYMHINTYKLAITKFFTVLLRLLLFKVYKVCICTYICFPKFMYDLLQPLSVFSKFKTDFSRVHSVFYLQLFCSIFIQKLHRIKLRSLINHKKRQIQVVTPTAI